MKIHSSLFFSKISNEKIMVRLVGREIRYILLVLITQIYQDARSTERQMDPNI